jgi:hypothetical protein
MLQKTESVKVLIHVSWFENLLYRELDKRLTFKIRKDIVHVETLRTYLRLHPLFNSEQLSANPKLMFYDTLIRSTITYACPA